jgi:cold shock CspA family protein
VKSGTIKHYNPDVGEGKITPRSGADVNFEDDVVSGADPSMLVGGEPVQYDAVNTNEGLVATKVIVLAGAISTATGARGNVPLAKARAKAAKASAKSASGPRAKPSKPPARSTRKSPLKHARGSGKKKKRG